MISSLTPLRFKILTHTRSSSLPSPPSHPLIPQIQPPFTKASSLRFYLLNLHRQPLSTISTTGSTICCSCTTHQVFARESDEKWVEQVLDGYIGLVDACATAKDLLSHSKEYSLHLLSLLHRRRDSDDLSGLLTSRKIIHKSLRNISNLKNKPSVLALDKDEETIAGPSC